MAILSEVVVALVLTYVPVINHALKFREIRGEWWFLALPFAVMVLVWQELRKLIIRKYPTGYCAREMGF